MATVQLRRYRIADGQLDAFMSWFPRAVRTREPYGFFVEFAYVDRVAGEFIWAVGHPGDSDAFDDAEARWRVDPERTTVFGEQPDCVLHHRIAKVEPVRPS
ncbi:hypothetical protein GCM10023321_13660 [Pseudonocardia eucalypti]|uniref:NIPSNAP protein n=1 Tax=Pseudonocardia eucalypti TaxID=648755 RepID=A0ABP9PQD4_9PSEU|nr:hypothetical protein [Pseudonocardia eucalypti]